MNLTLPKDETGSLVKYWLILAISALATAGLYSLPPVILRGPLFAKRFDVDHIFSTALVVHVDLSVLVWFLSIAGVLWSLLADKKYLGIYKTVFYLTALGTAIIAISPWIGYAHPLKNNYIPVLQDPTFFVGLCLFGAGIFAQTCLTLLNYRKANENALYFGVYISAIIIVIAAICFYIALQITPVPTDGSWREYYENIFWGGGHILQFTFTTTMLVVWLWLADICNVKTRPVLSNRAIWVLFALNLIIVLPSPLFYTDGDPHTAMFMQQMRHGLGIAPLIIGAALILGMFGNKRDKKIPHAVKACLILSIFLFGYGGLLGYMISGINVTIPAHYHGSIVAVTLAFIGIAYYLLPQLGYGEIKGKIATAQPYIYGVGQVVHVTGLAWMGGYGALRKSADSSHQITNIFPKLMFFTGGALAILGGLLFIVVAYRSILKKS